MPSWISSLTFLTASDADRWFTPGGGRHYSREGRTLATFPDYHHEILRAAWGFVSPSRRRWRSDILRCRIPFRLRRDFTDRNVARKTSAPIHDDAVSIMRGSPCCFATLGISRCSSEPISIWALTFNSSSSSGQCVDVVLRVLH